MDFNSTVKFGTVVWTALSAVDDDNTDTNRDPNSKPVSNVRVTFTASTPRIVIQDPSPATIFLQSIDARTNEHGVLVGSDGAEGIKLVASDNVKASPVNFTYRVNISGLGVPIMFDISVPSDGVVDLSFLVPIVSSAGKVLAPERGPQGDPGPPPELAIGSVKSSAGSAEANLRPNPAGGHFLDLGLPLGPRGPQGDPGGWNVGVNLLDSDLDTITYPGLYHQPSTTYALDPVKHYPPIPNYGGIARGVLHVSSWSGGTHVIQEYHHIGYTGNVANSTSERPPVVWRRYKDVIWGKWYMFAPQRVDNTAGRVVYIWDETANQEQVIYSDTGWRNIDVSNVTGSIRDPLFPGTFRIRRIGNVVTIRMEDVKLIPGNGLQFLYPNGLPVGFRSLDLSGTVVRGIVGERLGAGAEHTIFVGSNDIFWAGYTNSLFVKSSVRPEHENQRLQGELSWVTDDSWPVTLPGTAYGTIPNR